jgi:hypothetical protein
MRNKGKMDFAKSPRDADVEERKGVGRFTYTRALFFGPVLGRDLGPPSNARLVPALGTEAFFFGTSVAPGAGVALFSEASPFPLGEEAGAAAATVALVGVETDDGVDLAFEFFLGVDFGRKRARCEGDSFMTTTLLGLLDFSGAAF